MSYIVNFTDSDNKAPITVYDNTSSVDTSLTFTGRNVTGYGQTIAENFLHLLENFASTDQPVNPVEGQLWYNSADEDLMVWDNTSWKAASGIRKGPSAPDLADSNIGELWIDTTNQQLKMFTGTRWLLVGPSVSTIDGLLNGPIVEQVIDTADESNNVIIFYIADIPVILFSKTKFVPKLKIPGFAEVNVGININVPTAASLADDFANESPKMVGTATSAESLIIAGNSVSANKFMRIDQVNTTEYELNVRHNSGITVGADGQLKILNSNSASRIYNSIAGNALQLQLNRNGTPDTIVHIFDNTVGINNVNPQAELDVDGSIITSGTLHVESTIGSSNLSSGSIVTAGGVAVAGNINLGGDLSMLAGTLSANNVLPRIDNYYNLGSDSLRWKDITANTITASEFHGTFIGTINGTVTTAAQLEVASSFEVIGDSTTVGGPVTFTGAGQAIKLDTVLAPTIISAKDVPEPDTSNSNDQLLVFRPTSTTETPAGLYKQSRDAFIGDLGVPLGAMMPFAGTTAPYGYLFCDGTEVEKTHYPELFDVISTVYNGTAPLVGVGTFRVPDLRGRFALGKDNMDNNIIVPTSVGGVIDGGGGAANRIGNAQASTLGGAGGSESITIDISNIPDHEHDMKTNDGIQFAAVRVDSAIYGQATTGLGPTAVGQAQYFKSSGKIAKASPADTFSNPVAVVNPFLTINYIIRSGPPAYV